MTGTKTSHRLAYYLHLVDAHANRPGAPDPNDPDLWDWGEFDDDVYPRRRLWQLVLVSIVVLGLVLLLVVNIL